MIIISTSYGNDSIALIKWVSLQTSNFYTSQLIYCTYCDTGWASQEWPSRVSECEKWVKQLGFTPVSIPSIGMEELVKIKKGFPSNQYQFCTSHLKGIPFLKWADEIDPDAKATVILGMRRAESKKRSQIPLAIFESEHHGGRMLLRPLYKHSDNERNKLVESSGFKILPHRSQECSPCVNANRKDFKLLTVEQIDKVNKLEVEIGKPMFRPKRFGSLGIHGVMTWAHHGRKIIDIEDVTESSGCAGHFGCGL